MAHFLPETIESVLANLVGGDEYFVIDGGSMDASVQVIRQYSDRLTGWTSEPDHGYAEALYKGFQRCTGEYLCWINSGDLLLKGALQIAREYLSTFNADLIFGDDVYIDEHGLVLFRSSGRVTSLRNMMLYGGWTPLQDACFWRRSLYEEMHGIDKCLVYAADYDFFLRAACHGHCLYIPKTLSAFRRHLQQKSVAHSRKYQIERNLARKRVLQKLGTSAPKRAMGELYYWLIVRIRHHLVNRVRILPSNPGTHVCELSAG
jgi:glycosyltransferase involved in cell wall biosynthesis